MITVKAIDFRTQKSNELVGLKNIEYLPVGTDTSKQEILSFIKGADVFFVVHDSTKEEYKEKLKFIEEFALKNNITPLELLPESGITGDGPTLEDISHLFSYEGDIQFAAGVACGKNKVEEVTNSALAINTNCDGVYIHIICSEDITLNTLYKTCGIINENIKNAADVLVQTIVDDTLPEDILSVCIIATGCK